MNVLKQESFNDWWHTNTRTFNNKRTGMLARKCLPEESLFDSVTDDATLVAVDSCLLNKNIF